MPERLPRIEFRCPTAAAMQRLTDMLHLPDADQDWEILVADAGRVGEFVDVYEHATLDDDERFALMAVIIASFDDLLREERDDPDAWGRIRRHLLTRFDLHAYTVQYWSVPDQDDIEDAFAITSRMREIMSVMFGGREQWPGEPIVVKRFIDWPESATPLAPLNSVEICDERDGSYTLSWSRYKDRAAGERRFASVAEAQEHALREFGIPLEYWKDI